MNEASLDRWITMRMLTEEVGEVDLDGYRITVVERAVEKLHFEDPDFEYVVRITKLRDVPKRMDDIERRLTMKFTTVLGETAGAVEACADMTDKEIGLAGLNKGPGRWVFSARKHNFFDEVLKPGSKTRRAVFETFRPTGNRLDGYTPGSAMNRFTAEAG